MRHPMIGTMSGPAWRWLGTALRVGLGLVFLAAGGTKLADPTQSVRAVRAYRLLPETLAQGVGYGLPVLEVALGLLLVLGLGVRLAALLTLLLLLVFVAGVASAAARGLRIDCGCFGGGGDTLGETHYTREILRDLGLALVAGFLALRPTTALSLDGELARRDHALLAEELSR